MANALHPLPGPLRSMVEDLQSEESDDDDSSSEEETPVKNNPATRDRCVCVCSHGLWPPRSAGTHIIIATM